MFTPALSPGETESASTCDSVWPGLNWHQWARHRYRSSHFDETAFRNLLVDTRVTLDWIFRIEGLSIFGSLLLKLSFTENDIWVRNCFRSGLLRFRLSRWYSEPDRTFLVSNAILKSLISGTNRYLLIPVCHAIRHAFLIMQCWISLWMQLQIHSQTFPSLLVKGNEALGTRLSRTSN